jgi:hypothetical protein
MANALTLPDILDFTFDALTAAVGVIVILLAVRVTLTLTLSAHRRALWISIVAAALIVGAQMAEVWADFSRLNTLEDVAGDFAELVAISFVGLALRLMSRAEKEEISSLRTAANVDHLTGLARLWCKVGVISANPVANTARPSSVRRRCRREYFSSGF